MGIATMSPTISRILVFQNAKRSVEMILDRGVLLGPCLVVRNFAKFFNISRHIESLDACMKH
jgi:hypothetical protein